MSTNIAVPGLDHRAIGKEVGPGFNYHVMNVFGPVDPVLRIGLKDTNLERSGREVLDAHRRLVDIFHCHRVDEDWVVVRALQGHGRPRAGGLRNAHLAKRPCRLARPPVLVGHEPSANWLVEGWAIDSLGICGVIPAAARGSLAVVGPALLRRGGAEAKCKRGHAQPHGEHVQFRTGATLHVAMHAPVFY